MSVTFNNTKFLASMRAVKSVSRHDFAYILNKALKDVGFRAMQFSEFAEPGLIQAQLYRDNIALKLAAKHLTSRAGQVKRDRRGNAKTTKRGRVQKHSARVTRSQIAAYATRIVKNRISGSKAVRAGWIPAVKAFGGSIRGAGKSKPGGTASKGHGKKASPSKLNGEISNALFTRDHAKKRTSVKDIAMARNALSQAVQFVTKDRMKFARDRVNATLRRHSDT